MKDVSMCMAEWKKWTMDGFDEEVARVPASTTIGHSFVMYSLSSLNIVT
jgi:hypothetical protein